jgi:hypothetical protein
VYPGPRPGLSHGLTQKSAFPGIGLYEVSLKVRPHNREDQARQARAASDIREYSTFDEGGELCAIQDVPPPWVFKGRSADQIDPRLPTL